MREKKSSIRFSLTHSWKALTSCENRVWETDAKHHHNHRCNTLTPTHMLNTHKHSKPCCVKMETENPHLTDCNSSITTSHAGLLVTIHFPEKSTCGHLITFGNSLKFEFTKTVVMYFHDWPVWSSLKVYTLLEMVMIQEWLSDYVVFGRKSLASFSLHVHKHKNWPHMNRAILGF